MTPSERAFAAVVRLTEARRVRAIAREAWLAYMRQEWGEGHRHKYGHCQVDLDQYGTTAPLCDICAGSDPLYQEYRKAARRAGGALQTCVRIGNRP